MKKLFYLTYSFICYVFFLGVFLYLIGFVMNITNYPIAEGLHQYFPKTLDTGEANFTAIPATLINLLLIALFGIQHSVMARKKFKEKWTKIVSRPIERSTFVLFTNIVLVLLFIFWQPVKATVWNLENTALESTFVGIALLGWVLLLISTYLINHFDLFGLRQVYLYAIGKQDEPLSFRKPSLYKLVRHPLYFSFLIVFWFSPVMTLGHFIFSIGMTAYIMIGIYHEEKSLVSEFGADYRNYQFQVPKIIPFTKFRKKEPDTSTENYRETGLE